MSKSPGKQKAENEAETATLQTEIYGYSEEEALQLSSSILIADRSAEEMKKMVKQLQAGITVAPFESWRRRKDGREIRVWLTASRLLDEAGQSAALAVTECELT